MMVSAFARSCVFQVSAAETAIHYGHQSPTTDKQIRPLAMTAPRSSERIDSITLYNRRFRPIRPLGPRTPPQAQLARPPSAPHGVEDCRCSQDCQPGCFSDARTSSSRLANYHDGKVCFRRWVQMRRPSTAMTLLKVAAAACRR
jgi:hypothetical protein